MPHFAAALVTVVAVALQTAAPTRQMLEVLTFDFGANASVDGGRVTLVGGKWTDTVGGATYTLHPLHAFGDLDGDKDVDAIAFVVESSGGSGSFTYMFAVTNTGGRLEQLGEPEWLGDRTRIERVSIDRRGVVAVRYVTHADGDPACCPTMKIEDRYRVEKGRLVGITK